MPLILQAPPGPNGPNGVSRPFLLGLLLLILFLSTQTDWSPAARRQRMDIRHGVGTSLLQKQETTREKLLYELTNSNEKLEKENMRLRQRIMHLNHVLRSCPLCANSTENLPFQPFLESELQPLPGEDDPAGAAGSNSQGHGHDLQQLQHMERHSAHSKLPDSLEQEHGIHRRSGYVSDSSSHLRSRIYSPVLGNG
mmetsp:Transcript_7797/g.22199  ORF Transcript_7797/g.22199 Transcript_7797/m.22199 type:complete len:196 (+) Transcript_7797:352-939(+)